MFSEFVRQHPLSGLLPGGVIPLFPPASDRRAWEKVPEKYQGQIRALSAFYADQPYPMRPATGFLAFAETGSRQADEGPYFFRRRKLCAAVLACCADEQASLDDVVDGLWCICEESSWVISAHNINPIPGAPSARDVPLPDVTAPYVDLFAAQTGMILALTGWLLAHQLDRVTPLLRRRIALEIDARVLSPFMTHDEFWWMGKTRRDLNNWTPWILSNILVCAWLKEMDGPSRAALTERALAMLDRWLDTVPPDGGCDEGAGYWNMAGGALLDCLELLEKATDGRAAFWREDKIRRILTFPQQAEVGGGWFVNFADCDARPFLSGERLQLAGERLGDPRLTAMGRRLRGTLADQINDVPHFTRLLALLFHPEGADGAPETMQDTWLPDLQVRLVRQAGMVLCCKGGHNGESHNHNDVGSFMLYVDGRPEIVDAGNRVYTAQTFSADRYALWHVRSAYHNVPLIGPHEQQAGKEHAARQVEKLPAGLRLDLAGAYGAEAGVLALCRTLCLTEAGLTVEDDVHLAAPQPITWVLMLRNEPRIQSGRVDAGGIAFAVPPGLSAWAEEIPVTDPRMAKSFPGSLWRLTLTSPETREIRISLRIERSGDQGFLSKDLS